MPKSKPLKIIVDTNLWISFIISNKLSSLDPLLFSRRIRLLFSKELIAEIASTITKPKLKKEMVKQIICLLGIKIYSPLRNLKPQKLFQ